jgi:hypothetical protein
MTSVVLEGQLNPTNVGLVGEQPMGMSEETCADLDVEVEITVISCSTETSCTGKRW